MTHLNIQQGLNIEVVSTNLIKKLYEAALSVPEPLEGELDTAYMSGNLLVDKSYRTYVSYLTGRFPDLHINVTDSYYIPFEDSAVLNVLLANNIGSDGIGVTEAEAANATLTTGFFENNTDITSFNTFNLFTKANTNPPIALFKLCTNLASVNLSNITTISEDEFYNCNKLNISLSLSGLTSLGYRAFYNSGITSITNLGSITSIPDECFRGCTSLTSVTLPSSVTSIGRYGFADCHMTTMDLSHVTSLGVETFVNSYLTTADLSNISSIGDSCFVGTRLLGTLNMPNLVSLGNGAFQLTNITNVLNLGQISEIVDPFWNCTSITEIVLPTTLRKSSSFYNTHVSKLIYPYGFTEKVSGSMCGGELGRYLLYILFPSTVTKIVCDDMYKDSGSSRIRCHIVVLATTPPNTNRNPSDTGNLGLGWSWGDPSQANWYVPDAVVNTYKADAQWSSIANYIFPISQLEADSPTCWAWYQANKDYGVPAQS